MKRPTMPTSGARTVKCPQCGKQMPASAKTCPHCGYRVKGK